MSAVPLWTPSPSRVAASHLTHFQQQWQEHTGEEWADYFAMHRHSVQHAEAFWAYYLQYSQLPFGGKCKAVMQGTMPNVQWFAGLTTNYARAALYPAGIDDDDAAILALSEGSEGGEGGGEEWTFAQLRQAVCTCAAMMRQHGVGDGDRIAALVSNTPEAVVILLAAASIGAVFSSCSPDFGAEAAGARFGQIAPKLLFAHAGYVYNGKWFSTAKTIQQLTEALPSVVQTIVIHPKKSPPPPLSNTATTWADWMATPAPLAELAFADVGFDHPLYILYSSGTTGEPKAIIHRTGGVMLKHHSEHRLHSNLSPRDRALYFTTCGWMMWNWLVSGLLLGECIVLYDGSPAHPQLAALWLQAARWRINFVGTSARYIHSCKDASLDLQEQMAGDWLRTVAVTGSPLSDAGFSWVYAHVHADVHLCVISGGTDIVGCFLHGNVNLPVYARQMQVATLGCDIAAYSPAGEAVEQAVGELVCRNAVPSMPLAFVADDEQKRYHAAYFHTFANVWQHGDLLETTAERGFIIHGRSDATLNPSGVRIGTAELYQVLDGVPAVVEAAAVGKQQDDEQVIWLFVVLADGYALDDALRAEIKNRLRSAASPRHVPQRIFAVRQLPQTRSGKLMEVAISQLVNGREISNRSAMANPAALDDIQDVIAQVE